MTLLNNIRLPRQVRQVIGGGLGTCLGATYDPKGPRVGSLTEDVAARNFLERFNAILAAAGSPPGHPFRWCRQAAYRLQ